MFPYNFGDDFNGMNASGLSWLMFMESGEIGYYMLHDELMKDEVDERFE